MLGNHITPREEADKHACMNEAIDESIPLSQFIADFGKSLLSAVSIQNPPIYDGVINKKREAILNALKRKPFSAQQNVIQAITCLLIDQNESAAIINAEMGTGKTMMGIATAAVMHAEGFQRTLILSPPHLVYKWRREILETLEGAQVWILNGPDTLMKLLQLRASIKNEKERLKQPEFFILGRVRLRMGFHWKPAITVRQSHQRVPINASDDSSPTIVQTHGYAACSHCGEYVRDTEHNPILANRFPTDKSYGCEYCKAPLWSLIRAKQPENSRGTLLKALCEIPTIGAKRAEKLINQFGELFLMNMLGDNLHQFINLMDEKGVLIFSDRQAIRMEKALSKMEFGFGQGNYQASEFIKRYLPKNFFSLLIIDEGHEYKAMGSAQGQAMGVLASQVNKILLLTGTLMGGYANDLFFLLWRIMPHRMLEDGYGYQRHSLGSASMAFMEHHGVLKRIHRSSEADSHKTARGKRNSMRTSKAPGFGPKGIASYVLPYSAFLKLNEIGQDILPPYQEHFIDVSMMPEQAQRYDDLQSKLKDELRYALRKGDTALLGVILNCLLAWPDCCFREEVVKHPRTKQLLAFVPTILGEEASPKEAIMIERCQKAKAAGQRVLVYTTYTGTRDTAARLKQLLEQAGLNAAVLRSSVDTEKREDWIQEQVDRGIDILICNPELVKTGLDLLEFPNIIFMQSGFNLYTLMQASRRSWRIGQKLPVQVYFLGYSNTTQLACLALMAQKIAVSQSTSGTMPETGLDVLSQEGDSIEVALAKQLIS